MTIVITCDVCELQEVYNGNKTKWTSYQENKKHFCPKCNEQYELMNRIVDPIKNQVKFAFYECRYKEVAKCDFTISNTAKDSLKKINNHEYQEHKSIFVALPKGEPRTLKWRTKTYEN